MEYHYVYLIIDKLKWKYYIGSRTSKVIPIKDIGIKYFSSSKNKEFIINQKNNI
jgi:hypothetical protein